MKFAPPARLGIIGGGQLGRMIALQARRLGYPTVVLDPDPDAPGAQVADDAVRGAVDDPAALDELARRSDVLTIETEHIAWTALEHVERTRPLRPSSRVLRTIQDRLRQKEFLAAHGFPQPAFAAVDDEAGLERAVQTVGAPAVLKSRKGGYDGKGQSRLKTAADARAAWDAIGRAPAILESFVRFKMEVSVVFARTLEGDIRYYSLAENEHRDGILHTTRAPARVPARVADAARTLAADIARALEHVGVMAVEMFVTEGDEVLVNEIAPRVHNSGHYTLGACATSQFEQHLRAVMGMPLGDTTQFRPAVMLNVLGDAWKKGEPDWRVVLATPEAHLHVYGKRKPSPGRKMAHIVVLHEDADEAAAIAARLHDAVGGRP